MARQLRRVTDKQITDALMQSGGNLSRAAAALHVARGTIYNRAVQNEEIGALIDDMREARVDKAEDVIDMLMDKGDLGAAIWTLKASPAAKRRGWGERQEVTGANGANVATEIVIRYATD